MVDAGGQGPDKSASRCHIGHMACYGLNVSPPPPTLCVETLTSSVAVFGDGATGEIIKVKFIRS